MLFTSRDFILWLHEPSINDLSFSSVICPQIHMWPVCKPPLLLLSWESWHTYDLDFNQDISPLKKMWTSLAQSHPSAWLSWSVSLPDVEVASKEPIKTLHRQAFGMLLVIRGLSFVGVSYLYLMNLSTCHIVPASPPLWPRQPGICPTGPEDVFKQVD